MLAGVLSGSHAAATCEADTSPQGARALQGPVWPVKKACAEVASCIPQAEIFIKRFAFSSWHTYWQQQSQDCASDIHLPSRLTHRGPETVSILQPHEVICSLHSAFSCDEICRDTVAQVWMRPDTSLCSACASCIHISPWLPAACCLHAML